MKLWSKIYFHPLTIFILFVSMLTGLFKYFLIIFGIVLLHELGHIIIMVHFKRKISKISILPFGGLVTLDEEISTDIGKDLLISIGGILSQLTLGIIIFTLYYFRLIDYSAYSIVRSYNVMIIGFNLIPICPLDGYKIVKLLEEYFISFKKTFYISFAISILLIISTIIYKMDLVRDNLIVFSFLVISSIEEIKMCKYIMLKFYMERMKKEFKYSRAVMISKKEDMYKNRTNYIGGIHENEYLKSIYCRKKS